MSQYTFRYSNKVMISSDKKNGVIFYKARKEFEILNKTEAHILKVVKKVKFGEEVELDKLPIEIV